MAVISPPLADLESTPLSLSLSPTPTLFQVSSIIKRKTHKQLIRGRINSNFNSISSGRLICSFSFVVVGMMLEGKDPAIRLFGRMIQLAQDDDVSGHPRSADSVAAMVVVVDCEHSSEISSSGSVSPRSVSDKVRFLFLRATHFFNFSLLNWVCFSFLKFYFPYH